MAQHDYVISNGTGAAVRSDLNNALAAIVSNNSGSTEPATTYAYMPWADTTTGLYKIRNSANNAWITLYQLDGEWSTLPVENGTAAAPSIYFKDSGTDTGFYSPGTDQVAISTGGTGRLFINSSGSVGVGTSSPTTLLDVAGNARLHNSTSNSNRKLEIRSTQGYSSFIQFTEDNIADRWSLGIANGDGSFIFKTGGDFTGTERLRIDSSGRLGVGTQSPAVNAHIYASQAALRIESSNTDARLQLTSSSGTWVVGNSVGGTGNYLSFYNVTAGSESARIDSSGRLLVGTSSAPTGSSTQYAKLVVRGNTATSNESYLVLGRNSAASVDQPLGSIWFADNADGQFARIEALCDATPGASDFPGRLVFSTTADGASSPTERMRIKNDGKILINATATASYFDGTLNIAGRINQKADSEMFIWNTQTTGTRYLIGFGTGSTYTNVGTISTTGSSTSYNTTSDYRLKENIEVVTDATDRLKTLKPCRFNFIADPDKTVDGFIAHEVQEVVPECVTGTKDETDADGNPIYQGIDQSKLVPLLTAALQEAITKIETLEAKVVALQGA